jgi:hypothetical protein
VVIMKACVRHGAFHRRRTTVVWLSIESCMAYLLYAGVARRGDRSAAIAGAVRLGRDLGHRFDPGLLSVGHMDLASKWARPHRAPGCPTIGHVFVPAGELIDTAV